MPQGLLCKCAHMLEKQRMRKQCSCCKEGRAAQLHSGHDILTAYFLCLLPRGPCCWVSLADGQLYRQWKQELAAMSSRIIDMRQALHAELRAVREWRRGQLSLQHAHALVLGLLYAGRQHGTLRCCMAVCVRWQREGASFVVTTAVMGRLAAVVMHRPSA